MTDDAFDSLMLLQKSFLHPKSVKLPHDKQKKVFHVSSVGTKDTFLLDCHRQGTYEMKLMNQMRYGKDFPMVRLEINAPPHMNPDSYVTSRNHIHIYKEGYGMKWAYELSDKFPASMNMLNLFVIFCEYCGIGLLNVSLQGVI